MSDPVEEILLTTGERVLSYAPCESFPEGHKVLVPPDTVRTALQARQDAAKAAHDALKAAERERLQKAREAQAAGTPIPPEKTFF